MPSDRDAQESNRAPVMTEQERSTWASKIRPARVARSLSQQEVADMAGVARNTVVNAESGTKIPQADKLWRIMIALDLTPDPREEWPDWVQEWIAVIAPLIQAIPQPPRNQVMTEVVMMLGNAAMGNPRSKDPRPDVVADDNVHQLTLKSQPNELDDEVDILDLPYVAHEPSEGIDEDDDESKYDV